MLSLHFEVAPVAEGLMGCSWGPCLKTPWSSVSCFRPVKGHFQDCHYQKELEKSWHLWHLTLRLWEDCVLATRSGSANREMLLYLSGWNNPQLIIYIFYFLLLTLVLNLIPLCHTAFSFLLGNTLPHKWALPAQLCHFWIRQTFFTVNSLMSLCTADPNASKTVPTGVWKLTDHQKSSF